MLWTVLLLFCSNIFMTAAWYGHLKHLGQRPLVAVILISWGIAFLEYCFQVPANRLGSRFYSLPQLKMLQEVITLVVFAGFAYFYMGVKLSLNYVWAAMCLLGAVYFIFKDGLSGS